MKISFLFCLAVLLALWCITLTGHSISDQQIKPGSAHTNDCRSGDEIAAQLYALTESNESNAVYIKKNLFAESRKSVACRQSLIDSVVSAMDMPVSAFKDKADRFNVWRAGAGVLGDLKASEAVDFLVAHLDFSSGIYSTTMSQQPALRALIDIGDSAIPKLSDTLHHHPDWRIRMDAVYCISGIGGPAAVRALKEALPSESDPCVKRFLQVSIQTLNNDKQKILDTNHWFGAFMCSH